MNQITLPTDTFHDMLVVLSFYCIDLFEKTTRQSVTISFCKRTTQATIMADDLGERLHRYLTEFHKELKHNQVCGLHFGSSKMDSYNLADFADKNKWNDGLIRFYCHETKARTKKDKKSKSDQPEKDKKRKIFVKSPLVMVLRRTAYQMGKLKNNARIPPSVEQLFELLINRKPLEKTKDDNRKESPPAYPEPAIELTPQPKNQKEWVTFLRENCGKGERRVQKTKDANRKESGFRLNLSHMSSKVNDDDFAFGWFPPVLGDNKIRTQTPGMDLRALLAISALRLFPTYIARDKVVVDGYYDKKMFVPLSSKPLYLDDFRYLHRHPYLKDHVAHMPYWRKMGVHHVRCFQRLSVKMLTILQYYFDLAY